jgi:hypothetical protein
MLRREMTPIHHHQPPGPQLLRSRRYVRPVVRQLQPVTAHPINAGAQTSLRDHSVRGDRRQPASPAGEAR